MAEIPRSTYRLQLNKDLGFARVNNLLSYFEDLGISDLYLSPILKARPGSQHGYDVVDPSRLNPDLGTENELERLGTNLEQKGMSLLLDIVPNHMGIEGGSNGWWVDVLENGPSSPFASYFDIDWSSPKASLVNRVLLPVLGDQFGKVLENQEIQIAYDKGQFFARYFEKTFPLAPRSWWTILRTLIQKLEKDSTQEDPTDNSASVDETGSLNKARQRLATPLTDVDHDYLELESIATALENLPLRTETDPDKVMVRIRERAVVIMRIQDLINRNQEIQKALDECLTTINGCAGDPSSFDLLEELLEDQAYRLSYWRVAFHEINYRRFFDINELAAIRVEDAEVFAVIHDLPLKYFRRGWVRGFRIDHPDGLYDPQRYFKTLQAHCRNESPAGSQPPVEKLAYVVVEKILSHGEDLRADWPVHGTTGYGFLNTLNGVLVDRSNQRDFLKIYQRFTGMDKEFAELAYESKELVLKASMSSELHVLTNYLERIAMSHRSSRDFPRESLQDALSVLIACFPTYRTYSRDDDEPPSEEDRTTLLAALRFARWRSPTMNRSLFEFIGSILLKEDPPQFTEEQRLARRDFLMRFQQLTGPVMAKGLEDTAFYRYFPLASLNEVGGEPERFGASLSEFHQRNIERQLNWPHAMLSTSTHDTKRSEDVRSRLNVLSEIPKEWSRALRRWSVSNRRKKVAIGGMPIPDANEEYLIYQTMLGIWPLGLPSPIEHAQLVERIQAYIAKAFKEAKIHTSWVDPNEEHDQAIRIFISRILEPTSRNRFLRDFGEFKTLITRAGLLNSLSQTLLKLTAPGVPDLYQGCELWNFSLVDPDNRRPVDFTFRQKVLSRVMRAVSQDPERAARAAIENLRDGEAKLLLIRQILDFRRNNSILFDKGNYIPLESRGRHETHVISFTRTYESRALIVVAGRFFLSLCGPEKLPLGDIWENTRIVLGRSGQAQTYRDIITGRQIETRSDDSGTFIDMADIMRTFPGAVLERVDGEPVEERS